jgi:LPXTG-motif cell wall-anchored protein
MSGSSGLPAVGLSGSPVQAPIAAAASSGAVTIRDFEFTPSDVTVAEGGTVTWTNSGQAPHTVTSDGFDSGTLEAGDTYSETFDSAGTVSYRCNFHPEMTGTVTVVAAASGAPADDNGGDAGAAGDDGGVAATGGDATPASAGLATTGFTQSMPVMLIAAFALLLAGATLVSRRVRRPE